MASVATTSKLKVLTRDMCENFRSNKSFNPLTKRSLDPSGPTASAILAYCDDRFPAKAPSPHSSPKHNHNTRSKAKKESPKQAQEQPNTFAVRFRPKSGPLRHMTFANTPAPAPAPTPARARPTASSSSSSSPTPSPRPMHKRQPPSALLFMASKLPIPRKPSN